MEPATRIHTQWQVASDSRTSQNLGVPALKEKKMKKHGHTTMITVAVSEEK